MAYAGLGSVFKDATADDTGLNSGNWTTHFTPADIGATVPWFEVYHMVISNSRPGTTAKICVGTHEWSWVQPGTGAEWDPSQAMLLQPGQDVFFYWDQPASGVPPRVTLWLRYDKDAFGGPT